MVNAEGKTLAQQTGTFRSNCMDCLDRTNVIQSLLARRSLQSQLQVSDIPTADWASVYISAVKRLKYLIAINHINVIVNSRLIADFFSMLNIP